MKVYVVMGGFAYEGLSEITMRTFADRIPAETYVETLTKHGIIDQSGLIQVYECAEIIEQDVE
jgi:hypothetical protein